MSTQSPSVSVYWKKSLSLFKKGELKLYLLGTLVTFLRSAKLYLCHFWPLLCVTLVAHIKNSFALGFEQISFFKMLLLLLMVLNAYVMLVVTRPSTEAKGFGYYQRYLIGAWICIPFALKPPFWLYPVLIMPIYFFFDSHLTAWGFYRAITQTIRAFWYFWPSLVIIGLGISLVPLLLSYLITLVAHPQSLLYIIPVVIAHTLFGLLFFSAFSVLYTKLKHEHFNLLFR